MEDPLLSESALLWIEPMCLLTAALVFLVLSVTCSRTLTALGVLRARHLVEEGEKRLEPFAKTPNGYLITAYLLEMMSTAGTFWAGYVFLNAAFGALAQWAVWLILAGIYFVFHSMLSVWLTRPDERVLAPRVIAILRPFHFVMRPLIFLLEAMLRPALRHPEEKFADSERIEEELDAMLDESTRQGGLDDVKGRIMKSAIDYSETTVREVMIPRTELTACEIGLSLEEALDLFVKEEYSRLPVYEGNIDTIVGILYFRDVVAKYFELRDSEELRAEMTVKSLVREAFFVPETNHIDAMFEDFKREHIHIAVVVDEFGGTAGVITLEDIVEEFFGEIQDEYDSEDQPILALDDENRRVLVDARTSISDISDLFDVDLMESSDYESVGGLMTYRLGRLGTVGDEIDEAGLHFVVRKANERCITQIEICRCDASNTASNEEKCEKN